MAFEFLNPQNSSKFDDLTAFRKYYVKELLPICVELQSSGENFRLIFKTSLASIKKEAKANNALKVVVAIQNIEDSLKPGVNLLSLANSFGVIQEKFEDLMMDDLGALREIYTVLAKAYGDDAVQMVEALKIMAIEEQALSLVYLIESLRDSYKAGIVYDLSVGTDDSETDFDNPENFEQVSTTLEAAYKREGHDIQEMRQNLLLRVLSNMNPLVDKLTNEELQKLGNNADSLIVDLEWDIADLSENPGTYHVMGHLIQMIIMQGKVNALHTLMGYDNFQKIFDMNYDLYMEMMYGASDTEMRLVSLDYMKEAPIEVYSKYLLEAINESDLEELKEYMENAVDFNNVVAMNMLTQSKHLQFSAKSVPVEVTDMMEDLLVNAVGADNPQIVYILLDLRLLTSENIMALELGKAGSTLFMEASGMLQELFEEGDLELFDMLISIVGKEIGFQSALAAGNSELVEYIIENHLTNPDLQREAMIFTNANGENALHIVSPDIDYNLLLRIMKFEGVSDALEAKVESPTESGNDVLTPLLSIVRLHGLDASKIMLAYIGSGADIFDADKKDMDLSSWVKVQVEGLHPSEHPVLHLLNKQYEEAYKQDNIDLCLEAYDEGGVFALDSKFVELVENVALVNIDYSETMDIAVWKAQREAYGEGVELVKQIMLAHQKQEEEREFEAMLDEIDSLLESPVTKVLKKEDSVDDGDSAVSDLDGSDGEYSRRESGTSIESEDSDIGTPVHLKEMLFCAADFVPSSFAQVQHNCGFEVSIIGTTETHDGTVITTL